ncbi:Reverse transcriptase domain [Cinara cedri]|uniref:Reverse transcriptase domain n=1 Tax=Cinara cedri TaxID=506608 RepID=A0A5E4NLS5_9HEMI|nr:Reverse transcriptase domain [Cinara cedri]
MNITPQERVKFQLLAYADDLVIIKKSQDGLRSLSYQLENVVLKVGLNINEDKMKYMVAGRRDTMRISPTPNDKLSDEWRINYELRTLFHKTNILKMVRKKRLKWAEHAWRSQNSLLRIVLEENLTGKRSLGRSCLRWKNVVRNVVEALERSYTLAWRTQASDIDNWRQGCLSG